MTSKRDDKIAGGLLHGDTLDSHNLPPDSIEAELAGVLGGMQQSNTSRLGLVLSESYRLTEIIGEGGMGAVFLARHLRTGGRLAVKLVHAGLSASPQSALRFELEARHTASLDHPNIVRVFDYGQQDELLYLVMEHVPGGSLQKVLESQSALSWPRTVRIIEQVLKALGAAHASEHGLIHRDIKPANILLTDYMGQPDFVKVVDFGISRALSGRAVGTVGLIGSPHTMAPEQFEGSPVTPATDLYAVGCTAYHMLAGHTPFSGHMARLVMAHLTEAPEPLTEVPEALAEWVVWLMQKAPGDRPQSAEEALEALVRIDTTTEAASEADTQTPPTPEPAAAHQGVEISLGPFVLESYLDRGANAQVWRGRHETQNVPVAIKFLHAHASPRAVQRELQAVARLNHTNIVTLLDSGTVPEAVEIDTQGAIESGAPYLVMEYAPDRSLQERFSQHPRPGWGEVRGVLLDLLSGLSHAHARGVIHLDIKPQNALVWAGSEGGLQVKLSDFGLARSARTETDSGGEAPDHAAGTPAYMAPEQLMGEWRDFGPWTDLYALGCVAWEMVCGEVPFLGPSIGEFIYQHVKKPLPEPDFCMTVPDGLAEWLKRLLNKAPEDRFELANDAASALLALESDGPSEAPWPSWTTASAGPAREVLFGAGLDLYSLRDRAMVGRQTHRDRMWRALEEVCNTGQSGAIVLEGPQGYGKSRLARWLGELVHERSLAGVLMARHETAAGVSQGLARMWANHFRLLGLSPEDLTQRLRRLWQARGFEDDYAWQALSALILDAPVKVPGVRAVQLSNRAERFHLNRRLLGLVAATRPMVVWLDDVQWGAESLAFVRHCLSTPGGRDAPVLFVLTINPAQLDDHSAEREDYEALCALEHASALSVGELPEAESAALVDQLLDLSPELARDVVLQMRGNPLFGVRLIEDWVRRGVLEPTPEGLKIQADISAALPDDLQALWSREIEHLLVDQPHSRPVLELAGALGQEFREETLAAACEEAGLQVPPGLFVFLQRRNLIEATEQGWAFCHAMFRDGLKRTSIEQGRWSDLNLACARMLQQAAGDTEADSERIARHLLAAQHHEEALSPLMMACQATINVSDFQRTRKLLEAYDSALTSLGVDNDDPRSLEGQLIWAKIRCLDWQFDEAEDRLRSVILHTVLEDDRQHAVGLKLLGRIARHRHKLERARQYNQLALTIFERIGDDPSRADSLLNAAIIARSASEFDRAAPLYLAAFDIYEKLDDQSGQALSLSGLGNLYRSRKKLGLAREHYTRALRIFEGMGQLHEVANCHNGLGEVARYEGRDRDALHHYGEALRLLREVGSRSDIAPLINLALLHLSMESFHEASAALRECMTLAEQRQQNAFLAYICAFFLPCLAFEANIERWEAVLSRTQQLLDHYSIVEIDVAQEIERAGELWAERHDNQDRAREAWSLARRQWATLDPQRADALDDKLQSL